MNLQDSILYRHLNGLSGQDYRALDKVVRSPFFNQREDVVRLWDHLREKLNGKAGNLSREEAHAAVFPGKKYSSRRLSYTMAFLLKAVRQYLAISEVLKDEDEFHLNLCQGLRHSADHRLHMDALEEGLRRQEEKGYRHIPYHYNAYRLQQEKAALGLQRERGQEVDFQAGLGHFSAFFLASALRHGCTMLTHQAVAEKRYDLSMVDAAARLVEEGRFSEAPAVRLYYYCYRMLQQPDEEVQFLTLKEALLSSLALFPSEELRDIFLFAINHCIRQLNSGRRQFIGEAFQLYRLGLEQECLLENNYLSAYTYKNITRLGLAQGEGEWVRSFLETYRSRLHPAGRANTYRYNLAYLYFQEGNYAEAMPLLQQVHFRDTLNNLDARRLLLRSYYELGEYDALDSLLDSFSAYLRRQKKLGYHRQNYQNLIRMIRKMLRSNLEDKSVRARLYEEVRGTPVIAEREWLLSILT